MDLLEKAFGKFWNHRKTVLAASPRVASLETFRDGLRFIGEYVLRGKHLQVEGSLYYVGVWERRLLLPSTLSVYETCEFNRQAFVSLTLRACMAEHLGLHGDGHLESRLAQRLEFLRHSARINLELDALLPGFRAFDEALLAASGRSDDVWLRALQSREGLEDSSSLLNRKFKRGDLLPPFIHALIPCLPQQLSPSFFDIASKKNASPPTSSSNKENQKGAVLKRVDLDKERKNSNPVSHSFEKLETADDYQGGHRTEDGEDALDSHMSALDEVDLSQVTRSETPTHSTYRSDFTFSREQTSSQTTEVPEVQQLRYREWSESEGAYLRDHCLLSVVCPHVPTSSEKSSFLRNQLIQRHAGNMERWRQQLAHLFHEPLWLKRQLDGPEIDLDAAVRFLSERTHGNSGVPRLYAQKRTAQPSLAVSILFDQSLSTDAWIKSHRVIDFVLESGGICGILFDGLLPQVQVAGTWSSTRHDCRIQIYKRPDAPWEQYFLHVPQIQPQGYTRLGPSIRFVTDVLKKQSARRKVLLLLTDGKPSDLDPYEGLHGIHDIRKACREAEEHGVQTLALVIDSRNRSHFNIMFKHPILVTELSYLPDHLIQALLNLKG